LKVTGEDDSEIEIQQIVKEWESLLDISENESILDDEHFKIICKTYDK